ncbi:sodium:solute symporter [Spongiimicrobium sp. 3-5]|uniref:sodium:solute symporter n=1 Tax=Spongiimicrobium sp. 3-5 TaxID=3332596 RepID=UPI003981096A
MESSISNIDIGIVIFYFLLVLFIGLWISRKTKTGEDLFLGGRTFGWGVIGLSLFASNISGSTIVGLAGAAYTTGIVNSVYEWMSGLPLIIAALIFIPLYLRSKITTIPEFLQLRYDRRSQLFFSAITVFSTILIETAGALYAGSLVLQTFFPGLIMWQTSLVLAVVAGIYTAGGGLKAVVYTDAIQAVILIVGCGIISWILFGQLDYDWDKVVASAPEGHFSVVQPIDDPGLPWPGLLMGVPFLGFWYWSTNQYIFQRVLGAKDMKQARWGVVFAGFLKIIPLFIMVIPGAMAISLFPDIANGDAVFPTLVTKVLPVGLVGLVLAGVISAIMSSVDSALNSSSTLLVIDFIKPKRPNITEKEIVKYGRITTLVLMIVAALWAPQIQNFTGLWDYLQQMFSIIVPPIAVIFLVGVFFRRGNGDGAFWTLILGTLAGVLLFVLEQFDLWHLHYTMNVGLMVILSTAIFVVVSKLTPAPDAEKIKKLTYRKALIMDSFEDVPWYKNYIYQTILLALTIFGILIWLW